MCHNGKTLHKVSFLPLNYISSRCDSHNVSREFQALCATTSVVSVTWCRVNVKRKALRSLIQRRYHADKKCALKYGLKGVILGYILQ